MKVLVLGVRGLPNVQGGVETHAENLYERLSSMGCDVEVLVRTPFVPRTRRKFGSIRLRRLWSPTTPGFEAFIHSLLGVFYAAVVRPDVLHVHAVGPALVTPIARLLGLRVVVTHHGPDYDRDKWGKMARWILQAGERAGMRYANVRIVISRVIADMVRAKYGVATELIPNGVPPASLQTSAEHVEKHGVAPGKYFLQVSRIVPEKRQLDLIAAYAAARSPDWKLVLVGGLDETAYSRKVREAAAAAGVVLTGFQNGVALQQLYTHAGAFVLPSSHEGLPIALLEALSYGLPVLASDIPANLEIALDASCYFPLGDTAELARRLETISRSIPDDAERAMRRNFVARHYDWSSVAEQTLLAYRKAFDD
jgi:glycosyltransferase involved in cell wall biosynthesis